MSKMNAKSKHISEVVKGDRLLFEGDVYTAKTDAYMTKTELGREWNIEVSGDGPESYIYASSLNPEGYVDIVCGGVDNDTKNEEAPPAEADYEIMVTRSGFATVRAHSEEQALEIVKTMREEDFDWEIVNTILGAAEIVEVKPVE